MEQISRQSVFTSFHGGHIARADKSHSKQTAGGRIFGYRYGVNGYHLRKIAFLLAIFSLSSCDRMITPRTQQAVKDAKQKAAQGEFIPAISLYESALDGSEKSAEVHYQLALLYDDKMNEPLHALHHFKRYLTLAPTGARAPEAKKFMARDELALITSLSGDSVVTHTEAARLRNENLSLRKDLAALPAQPRAAGPANKAPRSPKTEQANTSTPRSHVVQAGDTLFSLSRMYYNSPDHWKDIRDANKKIVDDPGKLKIGQTLTIP